MAGTDNQAAKPEQPPGSPGPLAKGLRWIWSPIEESLHFLAPVRFVVIPILALAWGLVLSDQGQDAVRSVMEVNEHAWYWQGWRPVLFCLATTAAALQSWYWSRQLLRIEFPHDAVRRAAGHRTAETWTPRLLGASIYLVALVAILRAMRSSHLEGGRPPAASLLLATGLIVLAMLFLLFVATRRRLFLGNRHPEAVSEAKPFDLITKVILLSTLIAGVAFVVWTAVSPLTAGMVLPAPSLLMLSAALWTGLGSFAVYWFDRNRLPLFATFFSLALIVSCFSDNHGIRVLAAKDGGGDVAQRMSIDSTYENWRARLAARDSRADSPIFVVATEGGGIRAAFWTAAVLATIQDQAPSFSEHLFAISGVSGGAVGASVFTALLADAARQPAPADKVSLTDQRLALTTRFAAQTIMSYDFLAPVLASFLHADLFQRFVAPGFVPDRAAAFEEAWERAYRIHSKSAAAPPGDDDFFSTGFVKMYLDRSQGLLPSLFLNSTSVETGQRVIASNCLIDASFPDARDLLTDLGHDLRLSTAAHNSARWTYVSPAGTVRDNTGGAQYHIVDGGYFENSGVLTALDVINSLKRLCLSPTRIHLIVIRFQSDPRVSAPGPKPERFMNELLSPPRSLYAAHNARGTLAVAQAKALCAAGSDIHCHDFVLSGLDDEPSIPLGWLLSPITRADIDLQVGTSVTAAKIGGNVLPIVQNNVAEVRKIVLMLNGQRASDHPDLEQADAIATEKSNQ